MPTLLREATLVFLIGALLLLILSFTAYRRSYYYQKAQADMGLAPNRRPTVASRLVTLAILTTMVGLLTLADLWFTADAPLPFVTLALLNLLLVTLLSTFDAIAIDWLILLVWRPAFLNLPPGQPTPAYMRTHIRKQFTLGWLFKLPIALLAAGLATILR